MPGLTESGNGCRIRTQRRADRIWRGWNSHRVLQGLNASNARQGIKTNTDVACVSTSSIGLNASNARQGIKTRPGP